MLTSESGKVVSFLQVDALPQILVSIRVLQIDRSKARRLGMDLRFDDTNFGLGSSVIGGTATAGAL